MASTYEGQTLLVANRGEIAVRIIRTAKKLGLRTIAVYSPSDTFSIHVSLADKAVPLTKKAHEGPADAESKAYLDINNIISICLTNAVTLLHPGYGFLSENAEFASLVVEAGITWLGPRPELIRTMGLKHEARAVAKQAGVPIVPGSNGLLLSVSDALEAAKYVGYPIILKAVLSVLSAGIECTVQDLPGRTMGFGIPRGGPMDSLAFTAGNRLVGNSVAVEGLEALILPNIPCELEFSADTVVAITGKDVMAQVNDVLVNMWSRITIPRRGRLRLDVDPEAETAHSGFRVYISIRGGLPNVPPYLGSKSTSMGLGGYQVCKNLARKRPSLAHVRALFKGRTLLPGDQLDLGLCGPLESDEFSRSSLPHPLIPKYPSDWIIHVLPGPQDDEEFLTVDDNVVFYSTAWRVSVDSNRLGIRLESTARLQWARADGGEGGAHPSNILDNGYVTGTVNINGDTPVILTNDGPDMGGYVSICTVASTDLWKLGQVQPGNTIRFKRISWTSSRDLHKAFQSWYHAVQSYVQGLHIDPHDDRTPWNIEITEPYHPSSVLLQKGQGEGTDFLASLAAEMDSLPCSVTNMTFPGRLITFPIVLDDPWNKEALDRYMKTVRQKATYLPSNIDYLAKNNGLDSSEALKRLVKTDWIDPRCRLVGQKMNPSRKFTPRVRIRNFVEMPSL
ncbi:hypothetical protein H0H87_009295 [Tephrocybe sp. NHM501043]|nr:hypothetical protein H0H87_009295 [Tephrocybe sp. NHM501043]